VHAREQSEAIADEVEDDFVDEEIEEHEDVHGSSSSNSSDRLGEISQLSALIEDVEVEEVAELLPTPTRHEDPNESTNFEHYDDDFDDEPEDELANTPIPVSELEAPPTAPAVQTMAFSSIFTDIQGVPRVWVSGTTPRSPGSENGERN
jgi:hypothetical protein